MKKNNLRPRVRIGENKLKNILRVKGFTAEQLNFVTGVPVADIEEFIDAEDLNMVDYYKLSKIAEALSISMEYLTEKIDLQFILLAYESEDTEDDELDVIDSIIATDVPPAALENLQVEYKERIFESRILEDEDDYSDYTHLEARFIVRTRYSGRIIFKKRIEIEQLDLLYSCLELIELSKSLYIDSDKSYVEDVAAKLIEIRDTYKVDLQAPVAFLNFGFEPLDFDSDTLEFDGNFVHMSDIDISYELDEFTSEQYEEVIANARKKFNKFKYNLIKTIERVAQDVKDDILRV